MGLAAPALLFLVQLISAVRFVHVQLVAAFSLANVLLVSTIDLFHVAFFASSYLGGVKMICIERSRQKTFDLGPQRQEFRSVIHALLPTRCRRRRMPEALRS